MASAQPTTDHETIRRWAEERGGKPTCVKGTGGGDDVGMIRLDFPGYSGADSLEPISWEDWFQKFDKGGLALLIQEETADGEPSHFNKLVSRETAKEKSAGAAPAASGRGRSSGARRSASGASRSAAGKAAGKPAAKSSASRGTAKARSGRGAAQSTAGAGRSTAGKSAAKTSGKTAGKSAKPSAGRAKSTSARGGKSGSGRAGAKTSSRGSRSRTS